MKITPNHLTWFRLAVAPVVPLVFIHDGYAYKWIACSIYTAAALTDLLDGILARRRQQITVLGKILDPIADKVLILGALGALAVDGVLNFWWLIPILLREISVTIARLLLIPKNQIVAAQKSGKIKVVIQHVTIFFFFLLSLRLHAAEGLFTNVLFVLAYGTLTLAVWFTLKSGYDFFAANGAALIGRKV